MLAGAIGRHALSLPVGTKHRLIPPTEPTKINVMAKTTTSGGVTDIPSKDPHLPPLHRVGKILIALSAAGSSP